MSKVYVIVEHVGTDFEEALHFEFKTASDAWKHARAIYLDHEITSLLVDVMKRLPDGSLTTEF